MLATRTFAIILSLALTAACGGSAQPPADRHGSSGVAAPAGQISLDKASYPVFPDADAGADPSVPAEQGGKGFTGEGWQTNTDYELIGDPRALKGGVFRQQIPSFPGTLRLNEYPPLNSYFAGGIYENPNNPKMPYDPQLALKLLNEAGWTARDAQGRLLKDGRPLIVELLYSDKGSERWLTIYQDDLRKAGVTLNLRLVTPETRFQLQQQRKFDMVAANWAAATFPNPETEFHSKLADVPDTNNITGIKDKRIDELIARYDVEYDQQKRAEIIREIDGILTNLHHYALEWDAPFQRIAYWNKFGHPEGYLSRIDDYYSAAWLWWIDPERERQLNRALADQTVKFESGPLEIRYWQEYAARTRDKIPSGQAVGSVSK